MSNHVNHLLSLYDSIVMRNFVCHHAYIYIYIYLKKSVSTTSLRRKPIFPPALFVGTTSCTGLNHWDKRAGRFPRGLTIDRRPACLFAK